MKKKKYLIISGIIAVLIACAGIGSAWAYFTTYTGTWGKVILRLGDHTEIEENVPTDWTKHIIVKNKDGENYHESVYVRVKAFAGSIYNLSIVKDDSHSQNWIDGGDGWYYYTKPLAPGEATGNSDDPKTFLDIKIDGIKNEDFEAGDKVNVAVVYETVVVQYDDAGNVIPAVIYDESGNAKPNENIDWAPAFQEDLRVEG